jgi:hypothetical protein
LTAKTHKDVVKNKFIWTDVDQKAFDFLRTCLITPQFRRCYGLVECRGNTMYF